MTRTGTRTDIAERLAFFRSSDEFDVSGGVRPAGSDQLAYLEPVEIKSGEAIGLVFPCGFMTALKCLEAHASPGGAPGPNVGPRSHMRRLASRLHDGRSGYRFFQDARRYPHDADTTALVNAALLMNGDLSANGRERARGRLLANRLEGGGFSVWLEHEAANRPAIRDAVVDMNVAGALALLSDDKADRALLESAAAEAITACERAASGYYRNLPFVRYVAGLWFRLMHLPDVVHSAPWTLDDFRGQIVFQHSDGAIGYLAR